LLKRSPPVPAEPADTEKLVKHRSSSQHRAVLNLDMSGKKAVVGDDDTVPRIGIVPHVDTGHQEIIVTDAVVPASSCGPVNGGVFPDDVVIPDSTKLSVSDLKEMALRVAADDGTEADGVPCPHPDMSG
jgi:hypothetical protein